MTEEEFAEFMSKAGIINEDEKGKPPAAPAAGAPPSPILMASADVTGHKRIKLYLDEEGSPKGDGKCTYLRVESVQLALQLLDESDFRPGHKVRITRVSEALAASGGPQACLCTPFMLIPSGVGLRLAAGGLQAEGGHDTG